MMADTIQLDWAAYYQEFKRLHGDPVEFGGRLLFPDGWSYAMDYEGPEYPPPADLTQMDRQKLNYWRRRQVLVRSERDSLLAELDQLEQLQQGRSAPLHYLVPGEQADEEQSEPLSIELIRKGRLAWLEEDLSECQRKVESLTASITRSEERKIENGRFVRERKRIMGNRRTPRPAGAPRD